MTMAAGGRDEMHLRGPPHHPPHAVQSPPPATRPNALATANLLPLSQLALTAVEAPSAPSP